MERLTSVEEFRTLQSRVIAALDPTVPTIVIPAGTCGQASGASDLIRVAKRYLLEKRLTDKVRLRISGCHGFCEMEPSVLIEPQKTFYPRVSMRDVSRIIDAAVEGKAIEELLFVDPTTGKRIRKQSDIPFFKKQVRLLMERNERVDPRRILDYIESGGYTSLVEVLAERNPEWVVSEVKASGLRGRGGAGFPTGIKWEMLAKQPSDKGKFIVCNADEGDPGAYMDRSILEGNPHSIIEGMIIGAFATGATDGIIYVCCEFPLAIKHIGMALEQAYELGLLGENILGAGFSFNMTMVKGAGAFVCGEETAMIHSIEGYTGEPRQRPPFPIQKGINGKPTAINNVETWANIPIIIRDGAKAYASIGTPNNSGTKIFSLVGKVKHTGLVEMPMGTTIGEIVYNVGGGAVGNSKIKAVQTGGPSGGCIPASSFDLPVDYDTLAKFGSIMGSGGMIVMDEDTCMVDVAKYFMNFLKNESCGKCFTCRKGTQRMYELLEDITLGAGTPESIALLEELAYVVKDTTMCGLGQSASNSVLSSLKHFRNEYEQHVVEGKCPSYVCKDLVGVPCQTACPVGTEIWRYIAQIEHKNYVDAYKTIRESNPFPSVCARVCNHPCEDRCKSGTSGGQPINIRALTRFVTDNVDPGVYKPVIEPQFGDKHPQVAVVGGGPAGLTAAHYLSLKGCKVTIFEQESELGGMLLSVIPEYKLPGEVLKSEIASLLNDNITLKYGTVLGRDITVDGLLKDNFDAVFLSFGAHNSSGLQSDIKDIQGVYPLLDYVKSVNLRGENLAIGKVGIIGGSVSAIDAARTAIRSAKAESVTVFYQGTREDMLAAKDEIDAAIEEGVSIETLVSVEEILSQDGKLAGARIVKSRLGDFDSDGRRRLKPIAGSEQKVDLDTLIITASESPDVECLLSNSHLSIDLNADGTIKVDVGTLAASIPGVFAGGDITGQVSVIDAIAAGKRAAESISCYLQGKVYKPSTGIQLPQVFIEPNRSEEDASGQSARVKLPKIDVSERRGNFKEVEISLTPENALKEAGRCLRCDLDFFKCKECQE